MLQYYDGDDMSLGPSAEHGGQGRETPQSWLPITHGRVRAYKKCQRRHMISQDAAENTDSYTTLGVGDEARGKLEHLHRTSYLTYK